MNRWRRETSALNAKVLELRREAANHHDPKVAAEWMREADAREASVASLANVRWGRVAASACFYALGLFPSGWVLYRCLNGFAVRCSLPRAIAAQLIGHAGKYIPGKAMVVFLRVEAVLPIAGKGKPVAAAATGNITDHDEGEKLPGKPRPIGRVVTCVFFETLLMMGIGGAVAGCLLLNSSLPVWVRWCAAGMAVGSLVPLCPPVLRRLLGLIAARRKRKGPGISNDENEFEKNDASEETFGSSITWGLLAECSLCNLLSWLLIGFSFAVLITAIPSFDPQPPMHVIAPMATASIALGMVVGFASLLPGGAGVREYVTLLVLVPLIGETQALLAVIAARLMFIVVEAILAAMSALFLRTLKPSFRG
ncbi:MAG: lysylphosphatidylglycerol synthase domain-containing protein [Rhodopirellula sp. JB044]|uniref:lysylphosphatidylglycerol synthase domain-containing protein n=1 Tax=Rhodopirellula sp. JB044 TaxID=3342844 RepID=UPI00370BC8E2